jgi:hypothetical protein
MIMLLLLLVIPVSAQAPDLAKLATIPVSNRIFAVPDVDIHARNYVPASDIGKAFQAEAKARGAVQADAEERLAEALETFRRLDPTMYKSVMDHYQLYVRPAAPEMN